MTVFTRGQRVQFPRADGSFGKQLGTFMARVAGEDGPAARARVRDSAGVLWKVRMDGIEDASPAALDARLASARDDHELAGMDAADRDATDRVVITRGKPDGDLVPAMHLAGIMVAAWIAGGRLEVDVTVDGADPQVYALFGEGMVPFTVTAEDTVFTTGPGVPELSAVVARAHAAIDEMQRVKDDEDSRHLEAIDAGQDCAEALRDLLAITGHPHLEGGQ